MKNSDKNKLFTYPANKLETQESVFNPNAFEVDV